MKKDSVIKGVMSEHPQSNATTLTMAHITPTQVDFGLPSSLANWATFIPFVFRGSVNCHLKHKKWLPRSPDEKTTCPVSLFLTCGGLEKLAIRSA